MGRDGAEEVVTVPMERATRWAGWECKPSVP